MSVAESTFFYPRVEAVLRGFKFLRTVRVFINVCFPVILANGWRLICATQLFHTWFPVGVRIVFFERCREYRLPLPRVHTSVSVRIVPCNSKFQIPPHGPLLPHSPLHSPRHPPSFPSPRWGRVGRWGPVAGIPRINHVVGRLWHTTSYVAIV